jgi:hypothetical protein
LWPLTTWRSAETRTADLTTSPRLVIRKEMTESTSWLFRALLIGVYPPARGWVGPAAAAGVAIYGVGAGLDCSVGLGCSAGLDGWAAGLVGWAGCAGGAGTGMAFWLMILALLLKTSYRTTRVIFWYALLRKTSWK